MSIYDDDDDELDLGALVSLGVGLSGPGERVALDEFDGLMVSTVLTRDLGTYETAILDSVRAHIVERYDTEAEALEGHSWWVEKVKGGLREVTDVGYPGLTGRVDYTLIPESVEAPRNDA